MGAHGASSQGDDSLEGTEKVTKLGELQLKQSELREKINALLNKTDRTDEETTELREATDSAQKIEPELRAALVLEEEVDRLARETSPEPELRERMGLRSRVSFARYLNVTARGGLPDGAEGELNAACKVPAASIPFDVWEPTLEQRQREDRETRALTPAPSTGTGVAVQPILPAIFSPSIAPMLRIDLPTVGSGAYSEMTISTAPDAVATAKGAAKVPSAGVLTPNTSTPKRISGGVEVAMEDEAAVGTESFDAALKNAASMSLSNQLDEEIINGPDSGNRLDGLLAQLTRPTNPSAIATWDSYNAAALGAVDGVWSKDLTELRGLIAATGWGLSGRVFRSTSRDWSAASYLAEALDGWLAAARLLTPTSGTDSKISDLLFVKLGFPGLRVACAPTWGFISIDDVYTKSTSGVRVYSVHVLVGDVIVNYADAYEFKPLKTVA